MTKSVRNGGPEDLPILPEDWRYAVIERTKAQF